MLTIIDEQAREYRVTGYLADGITSMDEVIAGTLEEAVAYAQAEWCEEQDSATVYDAHTMETLLEIACDGTIRLALKSGWRVEVS